MQIVSILHNQATQRFHPILFAYAPPPGGDQEGGARRYRSRGHHTAGLDTWDEAVAQAHDLVGRAGASVLALESAIDWDGSGVPAMLLWFARCEGKLSPMF